MEDLVNDVLNAGLDVPNSPTAAAAAPPHAHSAALDSCLRILVQLTHDDDIVDTMVQDPSVLGRLSAWLTYPENVLSGPGVDLAVCAALCLGNMARNDANSTLLVQQHRFARHVAHLLEAVKNAKVSMAALSALRHFAMPMENKAVLGQLAVTETVMPSMLSPIPDVSLTAIVIHRQLASEERNMRTIIMSKHQKMNQTALEVALAAILKHSEQNAIKCEVGRLVGVLAKTAARSGAKDMLDALATTAMSPLWHILQLPYAVVWNEAIVALTLLLTQSPKASEVAVPVTFAADVSGVFAASNSLEFRCNAAQLLVIIQSLHPEWKGKFEEVRTKALNELKSSPADTTPEDPERREIAAKYVGLLTHVE
ncbi:hypothetical protein BC828DRAFT_141643 [Blastocladiella britannica]|nr:hypothetical protein BC828DRAFT_141643 [Blastocladiella britannica]